MYHVHGNSLILSSEPIFSPWHALVKQQLIIIKASITDVEIGIYKVLRLNIWKLFWEGLIESLKKYNFYSHECQGKKKNHFSNFNPLALFHKNQSSRKLKSGFGIFPL